ncbi:DUF4440 domain-containing protein [Herbiconiux sp. P18]|uniref:nuclear transport factor 2 family protein n=1 Tax=Herbiconiux liangxiaofengii TaxID=3342795 RepID=UPI0035B6E812
MWQNEGAGFEQVRDAELSLLTSAVRRDSDRVASLIAEDFVEIGLSGRRWTSADTIAALQGEEPRPQPQTSEWMFNRLSAELVLVTYRIHGAEHDSRHSSLWEIAGPRLRFHQGTIIP